jgi:hypothetical protein
MANENLLKAIKEFEGKNTSFKQTTLYPNIDSKSIDLVKNDFSEYDPENEIPMVFWEGQSDINHDQWIFISNKHLYYKIDFFPPALAALDCIALNKIKSIKIRSLWVLHYVVLNGKKVGSITAPFAEVRFLKKMIKAIMENYDFSELVDIEKSPKMSYYPSSDWQHLENASLFTLVNDYFLEHNEAGRLWGYFLFSTNPYIKPEKLAMARQEYADYDPDKEIPLLFVENTTVTPTGIVITNKCLYYNLKPSITKPAKKNKLTLDQLYSFKVKSKFLGWIYINDRRKGFTNPFDITDRNAGKVFQEIVNLIIQEVHRNEEANP